MMNEQYDYDAKLAFPLVFLGSKQQIWSQIWQNTINHLRAHPQSTAVIYSQDASLVDSYPGGMPLSPELLSLSRRIFFDDQETLFMAEEEREGVSSSLLDKHTIIILVEITATLMKGERWPGQPLAAYLARLAETMNQIKKDSTTSLKIWLAEYQVGSAALPILKYYCRVKDFSVSEAECNW